MVEPRDAADTSRRTLLAAAAGLPLAGLGLSACGTDLLPIGGGDEPDLAAELPRREPGPAEGAGEKVVPFTARMLALIDREEVNAVCSPLSAQTALTMAALGAAGATRAQMEEALSGTVEELAETANTLSAVLAAVGDRAREEDDPDLPEPAVASLVNSTWLQEGFEVEQLYLDALAQWFGSGVFEVDYIDPGAREAGRERINDWVLEQTNDLIEELIPPDALSEDTRLVLVNALHLKASWPAPLQKTGGTFTTSGGEQVSAEMLRGSVSAWYEDALCQATALAAAGGELALALVLPVGSPAEVLDAWAESADEPAAGLGALLAGLENAQETVDVTVPAIDIDWDSSLVDLLRELGMADAFTDIADFSGISTAEKLLISDVIQKAVLTIDENGMEAAAATAVVMEAGSAPLEPEELVLDRPFLVVAYERTTLAPLVAGWIGDPTQTR
ncbi:serpin family protein [Brachybacterium sp. J144]|uniref:serpin family protein n=1 Tax=Brachybacterium sp. J144 TaxID=3116487 RepID=UPI002E76063C|nr:serpin family protein [Brachybacterium sp. J144]MEE1650006.1 serpin family protein [Brachybacterium sp. J144]